jgi:hypothetical protein
MSSNMSAVDRLLRILVGSLLICLGGFVYAGSVVGFAIDVMGMVALVTGAIRFCGLYRLLGISTRRTDSL